MAKGGFPRTDVPLTIPGCIVYIDSRDTSSKNITESGGYISAIRNRANSQITISNGSGSTQPQMEVIDGNNVISFDYTRGDFLEFSTSDVGDAPCTIMIYAAAPTIEAVDQYIIARDGGTNGAFRILRQSGAGYLNSYIIDATGALGAGANTIISSAPQIMLMQWGQNGDYVRAQRNNGSLTQSARVVNNYNNSYSSSVRLGATATGGKFNGWIGRVLIYNRELTATERTALFRDTANAFGQAIS